MIVTYNWLKEFVDFELSPEDLSHRLTMAGLEVDSMDRIGEGLDSVIVARRSPSRGRPPHGVQGRYGIGGSPGRLRGHKSQIG